MILWSGGCDSTLILHDALAERRKLTDSNSWVWPVVTLAIAQDGVAALDEQRAARNAIRAELEKRGDVWKHLEVHVSVDGGYILEFPGLSQPQLWISVAHSYLGKAEPLIVGWHDGDHVWSRMADVRTAFEALQRIGGRTGQIETPLRYDRKSNIIKRLKATGLYDLTWYCEAPKDGRRCEGHKVCTPCRVHALALAECDMFEEYVL